MVTSEGSRECGSSALTPGNTGGHSATAADKDAEAEGHPEGACRGFCVLCVRWGWPA